VPLDALSESGAQVEELGAEAASPAMRNCLKGLAARTGKLLDESALFSPQIADFRLAMEVAVIQSLAQHLVHLLLVRDPLSERVHLKGASAAVPMLAGILTGAWQRLGRAFSAPARSYRA